MTRNPRSKPYQELFKAAFDTSEGPYKHQSILIPNCNGEILRALQEFVSSSRGYQLPSGFLFTDDRDCTSAIKEEISNTEITLCEQDFLQDLPFSQSQRFDFIVGSPPSLPRDSIGDGKTREFLENFPTAWQSRNHAVTLAYIEQGLRQLNKGGVLTYIVPNSLVSQEERQLSELLLHSAEDRQSDLDEVGTDRLNYYNNIEISCFRIGDSGSVFDEYVSGPSILICENTGEAQPALPGFSPPFEPSETWDLPEISAKSIMTTQVRRISNSASVPEAVSMLNMSGDEAILVVNELDEIVGYVSRGGLPEMIEGGELSPANIVEDMIVDLDSDVLDVCAKLLNSRFVFVRSNDEITGTIDRVDLNRTPMYIHLYELLGEFEAILRSEIRLVKDWEDRSNVKIARKPSNQMEDKLVCASTRELVGTFREVCETPRVVKGYNSELPPWRVIKNICELRNDVAHFQPLVHTQSSRRLSPESRPIGGFLECYEYLRTIHNRV